MSITKENTALFIGHNDCFGLKAECIKAEIIQLINKGVVNFLSGGQGGFDRLAARCVFELKKDYKNIKNILVIPYLSFNIFNKDLFDSVITFDGVEKCPYKAAIIRRNEYMVKLSDYAICYINHSIGGAAQTYRYAGKLDLKTVNLGNYNA